MSPDIFSDQAVDLVIFTLVDEAEIRNKVWDEDLISPNWVGGKDASGLSLFVVTVPADLHVYLGEATRRFLPGGYLGKAETLEQASRRIAQERLGLSLKTKIRQLGIFDDPKRHPNGRVLSFAYWALVNFEDIRKFLGGRDRIGLELVNSNRFMNQWDELEGLSRFDGVSRFGNRLMPDPIRRVGHEKHLTDRMPGGQILALDYDQMVFYAWRALRHAFDGRLDPFRYLGINPLGEEFRLSDLQEFTEVCRGERIQRDLFRRQMTSADSFLKPTGRIDKNPNRPGKPANLYALEAPPEPTSD